MMNVNNFFQRDIYKEKRVNASKLVPLIRTQRSDMYIRNSDIAFVRLI